MPRCRASWPSACLWQAPAPRALLLCPAWPASAGGRSPARHPPVMWAPMQAVSAASVDVSLAALTGYARSTAGACWLLLSRSRLPRALETGALPLFSRALGAPCRSVRSAPACSRGARPVGVWRAPRGTCCPSRACARSPPRSRAAASGPLFHCRTRLTHHTEPPDAPTPNGFTPRTLRAAGRTCHSPRCHQQPHRVPRSLWKQTAKSTPNPVSKEPRYSNHRPERLKLPQ